MSTNISITDVTSSFAREPLQRRKEELQPLDAKQCVVQRYLLAHWGIAGSSWPNELGEVFVKANLYPHDVNGRTLWVATIIFMNNDLQNTAYGFWKTFRVDFPNDRYNESYDDELKDLLRGQLVHLGGP